MAGEHRLNGPVRCKTAKAHIFGAASVGSWAPLILPYMDQKNLLDLFCAPIANGSSSFPMYTPASENAATNINITINNINRTQFQDTGAMNLESIALP